MILEVESIAEEIAIDACGKSLVFLRGDFTEAQRSQGKFGEVYGPLEGLFRKAGIIRYYRMGINPELWMGKTEDVKWAKEFLGMPTLDEQKQKLRDKGFLK